MNTEIEQVKANVNKGMSTDRHYLLTHFPFIGNILMRMELIAVRDKRVRTACTDGRSIYFDISFYNKLTTLERRFVLAHEVWHCVLLHLARKQTRDAELFNIATDMEVNYMLVQQEKLVDAESKPPKIVPPANLLFPPKELEGKSAETIYEWLLKNRDNLKQILGDSSDSSGSGNDNDEDGSSDNGSIDSRYGNGGTTYKPGANGKANKNGKKQGKISGQFDKHKYSGQGKEEQNINETITDEYGEVGYDDDFNPMVSRDFSSRMREAVLAEVQRAERTKGKLPAGLKNIIKKLLKPEVKWEQHLQQFVTQCIGDKRQWLPPHRRGVWNDVYFQSRKSSKLKVAVIVDTSGSCWGDLSKFFTELNQLVKTFGKYEMTVIQCDAAVHDITKYSDENPFPVDDPNAIDIKGCGGSSFIPAYKALRTQKIENDVDCIVTITDGYIDFPKNPPSKHNLIILTKDGDMNCCSWGKKIKFKNSSYSNY